jgi:hypothetical protein
MPGILPGARKGGTTHQRHSQANAKKIKKEKKTVREVSYMNSTVL